MIDQELDALVAAAASVTDRQLAELSMSTAETELCEAIMRLTTTVAAPIVNGPVPARPRRKRITPTMMALTANAVLVVVVGLVAWNPLNFGSSSAYAAPLVEFARSSPQLLVTEPGWNVTSAHEYGHSEGEMTFVNGDRKAELHWRAGSYQEWADDRAAGAGMTTQRAVRGQQAQITRQFGTNDFAALWPENGQTIEFRSVASDLAQFERLVDSLRRVDVDAWLSAMPRSVIQSFDQGNAARRMLADVALPVGFDTTAALADTGLKDRYYLGYQVITPVVCAWINQWVTATHEGDQAAAQQAVDALASSRNWAILNEMRSQGGFPRVVWKYADGVAAGGTTRDGHKVEDGYRFTFGCQ